MSQEKTSEDEKAQTKTSIVPLTIRTLLKISNTKDENLQIDGQPLTQIAILGRVIRVEDYPSRMMFCLDDTTGQLETIYYKKNDVVPESISKIANKNDIYVKAIVTVKNFQGKKVNIIMGLEEVTDYNQITYFMLSCFISHTKRVQKDEVIVQEEEKKSSQMMDTNSRSRPLPVQQSNGGLSQQAVANSANATKVDPNMKLVRNVISKIQGETGASVTLDQVLLRIPGKFDRKTLKEYVDKLIDEGEIYYYGDEDHYKTL